jgi:hypothetical protein
MSDLIISDEKKESIPFVENLVSIGKIVAKLGFCPSGLEKAKMKELDFPTTIHNRGQWGAVVDLDVIDDRSHLRHTPSIWLQGEKTFLRYKVGGNIEFLFDPNRIPEAETFGVQGTDSSKRFAKPGRIDASITTLNLSTVNYLNNFTSRALADLNKFVSG